MRDPPGVINFDFTVLVLTHGSFLNFDAQCDINISSITRPNTWSGIKAGSLGKVLLIKNVINASPDCKMRARPAGQFHQDRFENGVPVLLTNKISIDYQESL